MNIITLKEMLIDNYDRFKSASWCDKNVNIQTCVVHQITNSFKYISSKD